MFYINYNDYELIYLVQDGSEKAQGVLYQKYAIYINKIVEEYVPYSDKRYDLIQEGLLILFRCIKTFNPKFSVNFYCYFTIIVRREFKKIMKNSYYKTMLVLNDNIIYKDMNFFSTSKNNFYKFKNLWKDEWEVLIYQECLIEGMSVQAFSHKYNVSYFYVYGKKKAMINELKKILTI